MVLRASDTRLLDAFAARLPAAEALRLRDYRPAVMVRALRRELGRELDRELGREPGRQARPPLPAAGAFRPTPFIDALSPVEARDFFFRLLLPVSAFFRDGRAFDDLDRLLPHRPLRILSAPCASGEEAWTLAALCRQDEGDMRAASRILAVDLHGAALKKAQAGLYPRRQTQTLTPRQQALLFLPAEPADEGMWTIRPELREIVDFRRVDLLRRFPAGPFDLIACRNLLIYLDAPAQRQLLKAAQAALAPDGILFLGGAESLPRPATDWRMAPLSPHKLYGRRSAA